MPFHDGKCVRRTLSFPPRSRTHRPIPLAFLSQAYALPPRLPPQQLCTSCIPRPPNAHHTTLPCGLALPRTLGAEMGSGRSYNMACGDVVRANGTKTGDVKCRGRTGQLERCQDGGVTAGVTVQGGRCPDEQCVHRGGRTDGQTARIGALRADGFRRDEGTLALSGPLVYEAEHGQRSSASREMGIGGDVLIEQSGHVLSRVGSRQSARPSLRMFATSRLGALKVDRVAVTSRAQLAAIGHEHVNHRDIGGTSAAELVVRTCNWGDGGGGV
ncbi:hypothetical protein PSPO01_07162 [Paraphaeosphaeria sporulosa]